MLICATPIVAFAEEGENATEVTENTSVEEMVTESEMSASEETLPDKIIDFITENYEGSTFLSLAVSIVVYTYFAIKKHRSLNGTIGVLNNNAIKVASDSTETVTYALNNVKDIAEVVKGYRDDIVALLDEIRKNAEEKEKLEETINTVTKALETSKMASIELAHEVAELLVLANIPNAKKEELYARHRAAVDAIASAENTEVITDDGKET
jgi:hypothetical protein